MDRKQTTYTVWQCWKFTLSHMFFLKSWVIIMHNGILSTFIQYVKCILCWYTKIFYTDEVNATDDFSCYSNVCVSRICVWIIMKLRFVNKANKNIYIYI